MITSTHPDLVSPPLSDSIDALFNAEKADMVEDSLTSIGRKRGRGGDETSGVPRGLSDAAPREIPELSRVSITSQKTRF